MKKTLVITGGSKGIGLATLEHFLDVGYQIVNLSRRDVGHPDVQQVVVDLMDPSWVASQGNHITGLCEGSDEICLVHCAGLLHKDSVRSLATETLQEVMQVNVIAPVQLNQLLLPMMKPGSSIIYIGSTLSEKAVANSCSYVTSKHAVAGLMRATCQDLAGTGVHTACVCPGFTDTEMLRAHVGNNVEILEAIAQGVAFGRLVEPAEIARTIYFCATSPVINGEALHVNLGQLQT